MSEPKVDNRLLPDAEFPSLETYRKYLRDLAGSSLGSRLRSRTDASDIVQDALLKAVKNRGQLRGKSPAQVARWLRSILENTIANTVRDHRRAKRDLRRERSLDAPEGAIADSISAGSPSPSAGAMREELRVRLAKAIENLPLPEKAVFTLYLLDGLSLAGIARRTGHTPKQLAGLLHHGLAALRRELKTFR